MTTHATASIAIVSGKGGVGKTNIALNLAYALHRAKQRVLLMDCDLGLANLDVLLGIAPKISVEQVMHGEATLAEAAVAIEPGGFSLLPAASGIDLLDAASPASLDFLGRLNEFAAAYEYFLLDAGAGIADSVLYFAAKAAVRLVVITPEPTSLTDAYALIKVLSTRHGIADFHVLVNQAASVKEGNASFARLEAACKNFLGLSPRSLGVIRHDPAMVQAVLRQEPLLKFSPSSPAGKDLVGAAVRLHAIREAMPPDPGGPLALPDGRAL